MQESVTPMEIPVEFPNKLPSRVRSPCPTATWLDPPPRPPNYFHVNPAPGTSRPAIAGNLRAACFLVAAFLTNTIHGAETAYTQPVGIYTVKIAAKQANRPPARTYIGAQLLPDLRFVGLVSNVIGSSAIVSSIGATSAFQDPDRTSYLHVLTGNGRGFISDITQFGQSQFTCSENLTPWLSPGTQIQVRPHPHLADLLGSNNPFGLAAGTDADLVDNIVLWDAASQQERVFYFHSTRARWEEKNVALDAGKTVMRYPLGFYIVRRSSGPLRIAFSGGLASKPVLLPVRHGANVFSLPVNLSASLQTLVNSEGDFSVQKGKNAKTADILMFEEPSTGERRGPFYFQSNGDTQRWREIGVNGNDGPITPLDMLSTLILHRSGPDGYVRVEGDIDLPASPSPPIPSSPDPGEIPLTAEIKVPRNFPPGVFPVLHTTTDLVHWSILPYPERTDGRVIFQLPPGESRAFYRISVTLAY